MADIPKAEELFPELGGYEHRAIFAGAETVWGVLPRIRSYIAKFLKSKKAVSSLPDGLEYLGTAGNDGKLICRKPLSLKEDIYCGELDIFIGAGTKIEPTALISRFAIIGRNCDVRHGAYLRGEMITGDHCTLGHTTEIKSSIIMNHTEMGHFNYIGDCILGSYVNIGAGTKLANLKFRSVKAKKALEFPEIEFMNDGEKIKTGLSKLGAVIGDYCETGCNSVLSPAVILGAECWVYPNCTVPSGVYKPKSFIAPDSLKPKIRHLPK